MQFLYLVMYLYSLIDKTLLKIKSIGKCAQVYSKYIWAQLRNMPNQIHIR